MNIKLLVTIQKFIFFFVFLTIVDTSVLVWLGIRSASLAFYLAAIGCLILGSVHVIGFKILLWRLDTSRTAKKYVKLGLILGWCFGFVLFVGAVLGRLLF